MRSSVIQRSVMRKGGLASIAVLSLVLAGCGSSSTGSTSSSSSSSSSAASSSTVAESSGATEACVPTGTSAQTASSGAAATSDPKTATSLNDLGGMSGLEAAAKTEGALNVIALPHDWANYGEVIAAFQAKYPEIKIDEQNPGGSSAEEIAAADTNKGTDVAPDVFDLGASVALQNTAKFAPYKVAAWADIPDERKEATGLWVNDYTGTMSVGYDSTTFGEITSLDDLLDPKFKGVVALNGNPTEAGAAFNGVLMTALANGGSLSDIAPGVDFWVKVKAAGNFFTGDVTTNTVTTGASAVVLDWSYNQVSYVNNLKAEGIDWKIFIPKGAELGSFYNQAINIDAPHPAAARLWQEFLYSPDAQNLWLKGGATPVLQEAMIANCTINQEYLAVLGSEALPVVQSADDNKTTTEYLKANWSKVTG